MAPRTKPNARRGQAFSIDLMFAIAVLSAVVGATALLYQFQINAARTSMDQHNDAITAAYWNRATSGSGPDFCYSYYNSAGVQLNTTCGGIDLSVCRDKYKLVRLEFLPPATSNPFTVVTEGCPGRLATLVQGT